MRQPDDRRGHVTTGPAGVIGRIARSPDLRRVFGAFLLFNTAEFGTWVAILLYAYERTGPESVGIVALLQLVPAALAGPTGRSPRRPLPASPRAAGWVRRPGGGDGGDRGGDGARCADRAVVYLAAAVAATSIVITRPTQSALLPSLSRTPEELTAANGAAGVVEGSGVLLGPLLAALDPDLRHARRRCSRWRPSRCAVVGPPRPAGPAVATGPARGTDVRGARRRPIGVERDPS